MDLKPMIEILMDAWIWTLSEKELESVLTAFFNTSILFLQDHSMYNSVATIIILAIYFYSPFLGNWLLWWLKVLYDILGGEL